MNFTKIRGLGGKLGNLITDTYKVDTIEELLKYTIDDLQRTLGASAGLSVWELIRGVQDTEVEAKTQTKSMLSSKNFKPSITTFGDVVRLSSPLRAALGLTHSYPSRIGF